MSFATLGGLAKSLGVSPAICVCALLHEGVTALPWAPVPSCQDAAQTLVDRAACTGFGCGVRFYLWLDFALIAGYCGVLYGVVRASQLACGPGIGAWVLSLLRTVIAVVLAVCATSDGLENATLLWAVERGEPLAGLLPLAVVSALKFRFFALAVVLAGFAVLLSLATRAAMNRRARH